VRSLPQVVLLERLPPWRPRARSPGMLPIGSVRVRYRPGPLALRPTSLANPSLEARPSEAVRLARVSVSFIVAHPGKSAYLSRPAQLERWAA